MRICVSKKLPPINQLIKVLRRELPPHYSFKTFGIGKKNILVGKSKLIGAELTIDQNQVSISPSPPSLFAGILLSLGFMGFVESIALLLPFLFSEGLPKPTKFLELEKEVGLIIKNTYQ